MGILDELLPATYPGLVFGGGRLGVDPENSLRALWVDPKCLDEGG